MENKVNVKELIEPELIKIFQDYSEINPEIHKRGFIAPEKIKKCELLFLGLNAAFNDNDKSYAEYTINWYNPRDNASYTAPYFKKFKEISKSTLLNWSHLDILFYRETNQSKTQQMMKNEIESSLLYRQMTLTKKLIELSEPKIIIASNTLVREFMGLDIKTDRNTGIWMDFNFDFDDETGTHRIKNEGVLFNVPIFFTSMLTGQRALDNGSYKRLIWHIKFILNKL